MTNATSIVQSVSRLVSPGFIFGFVAYFLYAYCYRYCWRHVGHGRGIVLISIFSVLLSLALVAWTQVLVLGPGNIAVDEEAPPPESFLCDPQGYRQWCSQCQRPKPDRSHHSSAVGRCVPKMDHFCGWLNTVIGRRNLKSFHQVVYYFWLVVVYTIVTLALYAHTTPISPVFIALYAISAAWFVMLTAFATVNTLYMLGDWTTLEKMDVNRGRYPIYNVLHDGRRIVARLRIDDLGFSGPYSRGVWASWTAVMGPNVVYWLLPIPVGKREFGHEELAEPTLHRIRTRFDAHIEGYLAENQHPLPFSAVENESAAPKEGSAPGAAAPADEFTEKNTSTESTSGSKKSTIESINESTGTVVGSSNE